MEAEALIRVVPRGLSTVEVEFDRGDREAGLALLARLAPALEALDRAARAPVTPPVEKAPSE